jgi:hypothetical protein
MKRAADLGIVLASLVAAGVFLGCAVYKPYEYRNEREMIQGPGLFSGEDGVFTIYGGEGPKQSPDAADAGVGGEDEDEKTESAP